MGIPGDIAGHDEIAGDDLHMVVGKIELLVALNFDGYRIMGKADMSFIRINVVKWQLNFQVCGPCSCQDSQFM